MPILEAILHGPGFTSQAGYYFRNWEYSLADAQKPLSITLGLILLCALLYMFYHFHQKRNAKRTRPFSTDKVAQIRDILEQSVSERATYTVQFHEKSEQRADFSCSPVRLSPDRGILLETSAYINPRPEWIGRSVICFFKVSSGKKRHQWMFYTFTSVISSIVREANQTCILVDLPERMKLEQRRQFLRIDPLPADIPRVLVWPETLGNLDSFEDSPPLFSFELDGQNNYLKIVDISASGLLLNIKPRRLNIPKSSLDRGQRLYMKLVIRKTSPEDVAEFLVLARIRNVLADTADSALNLGVSFEAIKRPASPADSHGWTRLQDGGIEEIGDWVFAKHLQRYREKGVV